MTDTQPLSAEELENYLGWIRGTCIDAGKGCLPSTIDARSVLRLINQLQADRDRWKERAEKFKMIAVGLDDDDREYETINNIAGCENNHWRTQLRLAIAELSNCPIRQETER